MALSIYIIGLSSKRVIDVSRDMSPDSFSLSSPIDETEPVYILVL